ncbi:MAG: N-acetylmuramoyl-L-alanine amidase [Casimicrobiaceae bacterium]
MPRRTISPGRSLIGIPQIRFERRKFLGWLTVPLLSGLLPRDAQALAVQAARLWPAREYTRMTIESASPIGHQLLAIKNPERLVLDLEGIDVTPELQLLASKVSASDPYIQTIRVALNRPGVTRLVLDLKGEVKPQLFALPPVAEYGHRLVLDLYPMQRVDPLMALLQERQEQSLVDTIESSRPGLEKSRPAAPPKIAGVRPLIIVIDPGHGGEDPGAIGRRGTYEKDIVLAVAKKLKKKIDREPNLRAMLTRDDDFFVPLRERVAKARAVKADLFISIHADAFGNRDVRGSSVFALSESGATSAAARWLAQSENRADLIGGVNLDVGDPILAKTLLDLSQTASITDSLKLGRFVLDEIGEVNALHKNYVEQAGFAVLKAPDVPSILIETAFISNPDEEKRLRDEHHQHRLADSMLGGIRRYFAQNPALARS